VPPDRPTPTTERPAPHRSGSLHVDASTLADLGLDDLFADIAAGDEELARSLRELPGGLDRIRARQAAFRDLSEPDVREGLRQLLDGRTTARHDEQLAEACEAGLAADRWRLAAFLAEQEALTGAAEALGRSRATSELVRTTVDLIDEIRRDPVHHEQIAAARTLDEKLGRLRLDVVIRANRISLRPGQDADGSFAEELDALLRPLCEPSSTGRRLGRPAPAAGPLDQVESAILAAVAALQPALFEELADVVSRLPPSPDPRLARIEAEARLVLAVEGVLARTVESGLPLALPTFATDGSLLVTDAYDLVLARRRRQGRDSVVTNDLSLATSDRTVVITGANQAGKTTFVRAIGQVHVLAGLGWPVPASQACLPSPGPVLTHFGRPEDPASRHGGLEAELVQLRALLGRLTPEALLILNEPFSTTSLADAVWLVRQTLAEVARCQARAVVVTFARALGRDPGVVSLVAPLDSSLQPTFRLERRPPTTRSEVLRLAEVHGLSTAAIRETLVRRDPR